MKAHLLLLSLTMTTLLAQPAPPHIDLGPNVLVFDPSMDKETIQKKCDTVFRRQELDQFGPGRCALLFKPGAYNVDVTVGFYTQVAGLGRSPSDTTIDGNVSTRAWEHNGNVTQNFWRSCENLTIKAAKGSTRWAVSQAAPMRRMHIKGDLVLFVSGWASGGFLADCKIDGRVIPGSQQQWISRNCDWAKWDGGVWNMYFLGVNNPPAGTWPAKPFTTVDRTPLIREKPFLYVDKAGNYAVFVPGAKKASIGQGWQGGTESGESVPISRFHIARPDTDTAATMNAALAAGKYLLLTPGVYDLSESLKVNQPNTIILGLGFATLLAKDGNPALEVADVDGVKLASFLADAGGKQSPYLVRVGEPGSTKNHAANPTYLWDIFCRVGGPHAANAVTAMIINSNNVIGDHAWIWRADHGEAATWADTRSATGLIVNGADVTYYGLFVEHFQEYQTIWNGENGRLYFYQSEIPYDVPSIAEWTHDGIKGWASYKVADTVKNHEASGLGIYSYFRDAPIILENSAEAPKGPGIRFRNIMTFWLNGDTSSSVNNVIGGTGDAVNSKQRESRVTNYP